MARSSIYYEAKRSPEDIRLTRLIDKIYTEFPYYGVRRMTGALCREGEAIGKERVRRLMREMGLVALGSQLNTSRPHPGHKIYPYLLRGVMIKGVDHVWSTDITYIRMIGGWLYLVAIMDWFSRYVLSWKVSITLEIDFCMEALELALRQGKPKIFNSDQGSQFTSPAFTGILQSQDIRISMDGRGRALDNVFVERLWRSLKYEEVYLNEYDSVKTATQRIGDYFKSYNYRRVHQALNYMTPSEIYYGKKYIDN
jgi:putative transposase